MAKKSKPKNKSKPATAGKKTGKKSDKSSKKTNKPQAAKKPPKPKKLTAMQKAQKKYKDAQAAYDKANKKYNNDRKQMKKNSYKKIKDPTKRAKKKAQCDKWAKLEASDKKDRDRKKTARDKAKKALNALVTKKNNADAVASAITAQAKKFNNEGNMAIYPTDDAKVANIVFFAPTNTESESNTTNVTSYAVDKGSPREDYARFASKTITIDGFITGKTPAAAHAKWLRLRSWHSNHTKLTFKGDIYYKQLIISQLDRQFTGFGNDTLQVSITFTFVRAAEVKTSSNKKTSKSSKTTAGSRNKNYTALTVKRGDTLWAFSQKYGKSVDWLQKVNKIKNPNLIYPGQKLRVK